MSGFPLISSIQGRGHLFKGIYSRERVFIQEEGKERASTIQGEGIYSRRGKEGVFHIINSKNCVYMNIQKL